jgi:DNA ligase-1
VSDALWEDLAATLESVAATSSKREKVARLADYLRQLPEPALPVACTYLTGRVLPPGHPYKLQIGWAAVVEVLQELSGASDREVADLYLQRGDLGDVAAELVARRRTEPLFRERLTLLAAHALLERAAASCGKGAAASRRRALRNLLEQAQPLEAKYLVRVLTGDLRVGLKEGLLQEAVAAAFGAAVEAVRRADLLQSDLGAVAALARRGALHEASLRYFRPFRFMLAGTLGTPEEAFEEAVEVFAEDKYDGVRVQVHRAGGRLALYSRTLDDVTASFPELHQALVSAGEAYVADAEVVAWEGSQPAPFHRLQQRLRRRDPESVAGQVPVALFVFDLLRVGDRDLVDLPFEERRCALEALPWAPPVHLAHGRRVREVGALRQAFQEARARGNEGLVVKRLDAPYQPGRRGCLWLKWKEPFATLDVVVVGAEFGHGKRARVLSDYTFAVRDGDRLRVVGKAYSGLTDAEIEHLTAWFQQHTVRDLGRFRWVEPRVVLEVAFDAITRSDRHDSGYALRFPRILRVRTDKGSQEVSTLEEVATLYLRQARPADPSLRPPTGRVP